MYLRPPRTTRTDTLVPYTTLFRSEVVRGGPSSVFYSNAPAGAINFIPRQVGDSAEGLVKYTVGNYDLNRLDFWYGTPIGNDWKLSTGGFYRSEEHTSELQSLMRISYAVFCLQKQKTQ